VPSFEEVLHAAAYNQENRTDNLLALI
jgi:hypothetical protein